MAQAIKAGGVRAAHVGQAQAGRVLLDPVGHAAGGAAVVAPGRRDGRAHRPRPGAGPHRPDAPALPAAVNRRHWCSGGSQGIGKSALIEAAVAQTRDFNVVQLRAGAGAGADPTRAPTGWPSPLVELFELASPGSGRVTPARLAAAVDGLSVYPMAPVLLTIDDAHLLPRWFLDALCVVAVNVLVGQPFALILTFRDSPHMIEIELPPCALERRLSGLKADQAPRFARPDGRAAAGGRRGEGAHERRGRKSAGTARRLRPPCPRRPPRVAGTPRPPADRRRAGGGLRRGALGRSPPRPGGAWRSWRPAGRRWRCSRSLSTS